VVYQIQLRQDFQVSNSSISGRILSSDFSRPVATAEEKSIPTEASTSLTPATTSEKRALSQSTLVTEAILNNLEHDTMGETWLAALETEFKKTYFIQVNLHQTLMNSRLFHQQLKKFLLSECTSNTVFPKSW